LRELTGIHFDVRALFEMMQMAGDGNVFAEEAEERALEIRDDRIDLENLRLKRLPPAKGQQLIR